MNQSSAAMATMSLVVADVALHEMLCAEVGYGSDGGVFAITVRERWSAGGLRDPFVKLIVNDDGSCIWVDGIIRPPLDLANPTPGVIAAALFKRLDIKIRDINVIRLLIGRINTVVVGELVKVTHPVTCQEIEYFEAKNYGVVHVTMDGRTVYLWPPKQSPLDITPIAVEICCYDWKKQVVAHIERLLPARYK